MKKLKIMLMSLALFAIVGGALAFKAKFVDDFCTSVAPSPGSGQTCRNVTCPNQALNVTFDNTGSNFVCTTTFQGNCNNSPACTTTSRRLVAD